MMTFRDFLIQEKIERERQQERRFSVYKTDDDRRLVFGWASIAVTVDGEQLEDRQHDLIDPEDLEEAAYEYVLNFGDTGEEHIDTLRKKGKLVESCVFTRAKQEAMGIPEGVLPEGWWIGFKIEDDDAWARVKDGTYRAFSIEGTAERVPVDKAAKDFEDYDGFWEWLEENMDATEVEEKAARAWYDARKSARQRAAKSAGQEPTGCGVLVLRDGKVLTGTRIERSGRGRLCGPGGHIEEGETPGEAAVREAEEEFGIVCHGLTPLGTQDGGQRYGISAVYLCTDFDGEPRTDEKEMTEPRWLDPAEVRAAEAVFPPFLDSLELLPVRKAMTFSEALTKSAFTSGWECGMLGVRKYNHNHDRLGRFASGAGGGGRMESDNTKARTYGGLTEDDIISGAVSGALDPHSKEADQHAEQYYEAVRHMKTDVLRIAKNTGWDVEAIEKIKQHIFIQKHDLMGETKRFDPSYDMAQSWQRLIEGKDIRGTDLLLLNHELLELTLMESGFSQFDAHIAASEKYNYADAVEGGSDHGTN